MLNLRTTHQKAIELLTKQSELAKQIHKNEYGYYFIPDAYRWMNSTAFIVEQIFGKNDRHIEQLNDIIKEARQKSTEQEAIQYAVGIGWGLISSFIDEVRIEKENPEFLESHNIETEKIPTEIQESLKKFKQDHSDSRKVAFIMMQFGKTESHTNILIAIRKALAENKLSGVRADDKYYHDDNYYNILTYLHGCDFGIAVFETITEPQFNPNISLEVGYLLGLHKPICLLKEKSLPALHSDLVGKLYREFDINNCEGTINRELNNWLFDKGFFSNFV